MNDIALEALAAAKEAIAQVKGVVWTSADNDHKDGEIIFETEDGTEYVLRMRESYSD